MRLDLKLIHKYAVREFGRMQAKQSQSDEESLIGVWMVEFPQLHANVM